MALIPCEILSLEVFDNGEESITGNEREREREREIRDFLKNLLYKLKCNT